MFSNRFWLLKVLLAGAGLSALGQTARQDFARLYPNVEESAVDAPETLGKTVWASPRPVLRVHQDGFDLETRVGPVRVQAAPPLPRPGDHVSIRGRVVGHRRVAASLVQFNEGYGWKRPANYIASLATLGVFLWLIRGRFGGRLRDGLFRSRS
jgi:hypothetical protein